MTRKNVLVPLDGSALADRILIAAETLLVQEDTDVTLLRILTDVPADVNPQDERFTRAREQLAARADELSRKGGRVRVDVIAGADPAEAILGYASRLGPSLIVTSTHGRSSSLRWIRGSVAERLLQRTESPVLLANPVALGGSGEPRPLAFRRILVPLDGSPLGEKILPLVARVAKTYGAEVVLLTVVDRSAHDPTAASRVADEAGAAEALLHAHEGKHFEHLKVRSLVREGNPASVILDTVAEERPDLVALTTHGRSGVSQWVFGSVAEQVLRHCTSPLLVYRTSGFGLRSRSS